MEQKSAVLINKGMNRDLSVSKIDGSSAYKNKNIRITVDEHDTLLSVTNERGTKAISLNGTIDGDLVGWNVLNNHIILFTHNASVGPGQQISSGIIFQNQAIVPDDDYGATTVENAGTSVIRFTIEQYNDSNLYVENLGAHITNGFSYLLTGENGGVVLGYDAYETGYAGIIHIPEGTYYLDLMYAPGDNATSLYEAGNLKTADKIYRIDYENDSFSVNKGRGGSITHEHLYAGQLGFDPEFPIESVVYFESEDVQKIYWVDGKNVLRFMNFMESLTNIQKWDDTSFDVNRAIKSGLVANISKDNSGNPRSNGIIQYILTYFNKYGQESGAVWVSDLVYLSPVGYGGAVDETNNNSVTISLQSIDQRYNGLRLYSIFRSSLDGTITGYLISETDISGTEATIIDNGANITTVDASSLLYIGSRAVVPGTLTHKDEVLFLGDLALKGADGNFNSIESAITVNMRESGDDSWKSKVITFIHSDDSTGFTPDIPYEDDNTSYSYHNQLVYSSSVITGYKGGEKYRFAIRFWMSDGTTSQAFWIGDATNHLYPGIDIVHSKIKRVVARCEIPIQVKTAIDNFNNKPENIAKIVSIQLLMAEATYADRSVKAQGIVNPTMFNTWDRFKNRLYSIPSWISRPRNSGFACRHFSPVNHSSESLGEIACNYWETENVPAPYYQLEGYNTVTPKYVEDFDGKEAYDYLKIIYAVKRTSVIPRYSSMAYIVKANGYSATPNDHNFASDDFKVRKPADGIIPVGTQKNYIYPSQTESISVEFVAGYFAGKGTGNTSRKSTYSRLVEWLRETARLDERFIPSKEKFYDFCDKAADKQGKWRYIDANSNDNAMKDSPESAANAGGWYAISGIDTADTSVATIPALYKKHLMFVDENVVTLNSPEIRYETTALDSVDNVNFRIVGIAKITGNAGDYTVDAEHGYLAGNNLVNDSFSASGDYGNIDGLISWPLWNEYGLTIKEDSSEVDTKLLTRYDYDQSLGIVRYWLHMWERGGHIGGYYEHTDDENSILRSKVFANRRYSYTTIYQAYGQQYETPDYAPDSLRVFNAVASQYTTLTIAGEKEYYNGNVDNTLTMPGTLKYPIFFSTSGQNASEAIESDGLYLYSDDPVNISYASEPHAVIALPTNTSESVSGDTVSIYEQEILPYIEAAGETSVVIPGPNPLSYITGALLPWANTENNNAANCVTNLFRIEQNPGMIPNRTDYDWFELTEYSESGLPILIMRNKEEEYIQTVADDIDNIRSEVDGKIYVSIGVYSLTDIETDSGYVYQYTCYYYLVNLADIELDSDQGTVTFDQPEILASGVYRSSGTEYKTIFQLTYDSTDNPTVTEVGLKNYMLNTATVSPATDDPFVSYTVKQDKYVLTPSIGANAGSINNGDRYLFVGELYQDYDIMGAADPRYGGTTAQDVQKNKFLPAGPVHSIDDLPTYSDKTVIYGNRGDTYFQRWDCLKTKQSSEDSVNNVIDITSFMVETHINIDGITDRNRDTQYIASINTEQFGSINPVYSQHDNYFVSRDLITDIDTSSFGNSITWTLPKASNASVDEWTHITLGASLALDGDKGKCRALRRFGNGIIAFQDKALSEILFNSRTQLSTTDGVPVEIANSGKVDGKRYVSTKYGCLNKWSIAEGKSGLYFIDNINKAFCAFNGEGVQNISNDKGFNAWFKHWNKLVPWNPKDWSNSIVHYDRVHSDVYIVNPQPANTEQDPCLVYNEVLGTFTSFYDYAEIPMMANVDDRFVSFFDDGTAGTSNLWLQNEGNFCEFFGTKKPFSVQYRVTQDPFGDKVWTNIEYRADFYDVLNDAAADEKPESYMIDGGNATDTGVYKESETFDSVRIWNEFQDTGVTALDKAEKKFRIWRYQIPRAAKTSSNKYGLDRIRNPWINIEFNKSTTDSNKQNLMQLHDVVVKYFE